MQKRRIGKVAISHFVLSLVIVLTVFSLPEDFRPPKVLPWAETISKTLAQLFYFFQPVFSVGIGVKHVSDFMPEIFWFALMFGSIPLWSICFGWLFVKLDNWLNHFPVLGKRVF